jgi:hypothetical protein
VIVRRTKLALVAAAAVMLSGCAALHPGTAAVVGAETITHDEVDQVAEALCSAQLTNARAQGQPPPSVPTRDTRQSAIQILLDSELSRQFGAARGVEADRQQLTQAVQQNSVGLEQMPEDDFEAFQEALRGYAEGQLMLIEIGQERLGPDATEDEALAEGNRLRQRFVRDLDVEIDPRYGTFGDAGYRSGGTALSVPASDRARAGERANPSEAWIAALPASQRCS